MRGVLNCGWFLPTLSVPLINLEGSNDLIDGYLRIEHVDRHLRFYSFYSRLFQLTYLSYEINYASGPSILKHVQGNW